MLIPINLATDLSGSQLPPQFAQFGTDEVVLVELQGALDVVGPMAGQTVGKLEIEGDSKKPTLHIGHNLLEGKLVNLPKPLAVMRKAGKSGTGAEDDLMQDSQGGLDESNSTTSWDIVAVVKRKMVFAKRPMPMVGRVPVTSDTMR